MTKQETKELIQSINKTEKLRSKYDYNSKTVFNKVSINKFEQNLVSCNFDAVVEKKAHHEENVKMYLYYCEGVHIATYTKKDKSGWFAKPIKTVSHA
jgi:hypothetical protein